MAEQGTKKLTKSGKPFGRPRLAEKTKYLKICLKESTLELWRSLRDANGLKTDNDLAIILTDSHKRKHVER